MATTQADTNGRPAITRLGVSWQGLEDALASLFRRFTSSRTTIRVSRLDAEWLRAHELDASKHERDW